MKKSLIALAVLAASGAAMAQSSVTLFGIVDTGVGYVKNSGTKAAGTTAGQNKYGISTNGNVNSRLGFRGVEDLGGGLKAGFWLESQLSPDDGNASGFSFSRRSTISLMGGFGEVRMGRELTAGYVKTSTYDVFGQVGMGMFRGWNLGTVAADNDFNGFRASNMLSYYTPNFGGFTAAVNYGFGESAVGGSKTGRYVGGYAAYDNGPLSVSFAMDKNNGAAAVLSSVDADRTQLSLGGSYDLGMAKITGLVQRVEIENNLVANNETKFNNWMLGVSAPVGPGTIKAQYASYDHKGDKNDAHQLSVGYVYDMSKRTAVYGTAAFMKNKNGAQVALGGSGLALDAAAGKSQTGFQVGVRHAF